MIDFMSYGPLAGILVAVLGGGAMWFLKKSKGSALRKEVESLRAANHDRHFRELQRNQDKINMTVEKINQEKAVTEAVKVKVREEINKANTAIKIIIEQEADLVKLSDQLNKEW